MQHTLSQPHAARAVRSSTDRTPWTILVLVCVAQFMVILDVTVVNVALPSIGQKLGFAAADLQWVVTAYVLMTGSVLLLGGRAADLLGRRPVFVTGLIIFTGASLASGLATLPASLIASRAAQGFGAALLSPAALSILSTTYSGQQRTTALSTWGAIGAGGAAAGVLLGGILTSYLGWESVFFVNVPVGFITAALALRLVPTAQTDVGSLGELDIPGAVAVVSGLVLLIYAIQGSGSDGWVSPRTLAPLVGAAGLLAASIRIERHAHRPLLPPSTWRVRSLVSSAVVMLGTTGILVGTFFLNSLFLQNVLGTSPLTTGLAFLPLVVVIGIAAHIGPHLLVRVGARVVTVSGLALVVVAELLLAGAPARATSVMDLLPGFLLLGLGIGLTFVAVSVTAMSDIRGEDAGLASGLMTTAHELGGAFGVSILSAAALGGGMASVATLADSYGHGALAGAVIAAVLVVIAGLSIPTFRPVSAHQAAVH